MKPCPTNHNALILLAELCRKLNVLLVSSVYFCRQHRKLIKAVKRVKKTTKEQKIREDGERTIITEIKG